jgi:hypothetical protein
MISSLLASFIQGLIDMDLSGRLALGIAVLALELF